jgi:hypothetical protein
MAGQPGAIAFFRAHDTGFRIRRLQLLARKLARDWQLDPDISDDALDRARDRLYEILALYYRADEDVLQSPRFQRIAAKGVQNPGAVLDFLAGERLLPATDLAAEELLIDALEDMPKNLKRRMLLTYLGFPFYDVATLPLSRREGLDEYNPVKIDRISPDDARSIREGGTAATLAGIEFYNFGAFFSRDYRENDYLWGRLHGAERMIDLLASTVSGGVPADTLIAAKRAVFLAVLEEEEIAGTLPARADRPDPRRGARADGLAARYPEKQQHHQPRILCRRAEPRRGVVELPWGEQQQPVEAGRHAQGAFPL